MPQPVRFLWLELTGRCPLTCVHCYAGSSPHGTRGTMSSSDWEDVITDAAALGIRRLQFIGGEPALHPALPRLIGLATALGLATEIYSSLATRISGALWEALSLPRVSLAFSWYTAKPAVHAQITGSRRAWETTRANIVRALSHGIPLRAGVVTGIAPGQDETAAVAALRALGVQHITTDRVRDLGRGSKPDPAQLCGHCGHRAAAVLPDGSVSPCPMSRWLAAGDVRHGLTGALQAVQAVPAAPITRCNPTCTPDSYCPPLCTPGACKPRI